jgi:Zn-dependent protease with chaperone function
MMNLKRFVVLLSLSACAGLGQAQQPLPPQQQDGIKVKPLSAWRNLQSEQQVDQAAQSQYAALLGQAREKGVLVSASDAQVMRLRAIARRLIPLAPRWNPAAANWKWEVNLLDSPQVNAFCMPGGRIAFYSGILNKLNLTDDEVAVVMGHEIAHALREHGRERAAKANVTSLGARLAGAGLAAWLGIDPRLTGVVTDQAAQLAVLRFSRDEETEADLIGLDVAARAGFDPRAGVALWQKMGALNKRTPPAWLSTHPSGDNRIAEINRNMGLLLPVYARSKGVDQARLPPYRTTALATR